jgi:hypothetical protein
METAVGGEVHFRSPLRQSFIRSSCDTYYKFSRRAGILVATEQAIID